VSILSPLNFDAGALHIKRNGLANKEKTHDFSVVNKIKIAYSYSSKQARKTIFEFYLFQNCNMNH